MRPNLLLESPLIEIGRPNQLSLLNESLEDVQFKKASLNRTFEEVPKTTELNGTIEKDANKSYVVNRTFEDVLPAQPRKLSLISRKEDGDVCKSPLLNRTFEDLCSNKLSLMNNNLFVETSHIPVIETSQSLTNIHETLVSKPTLKKQGTFEILDDIDNDDDNNDSYSKEEDNPYQTMVLHQRESAGSNGYGKLGIFLF